MSIAKLEKNDDNSSSYVDEGVNLLEMCRLCLKKSDDLIGIFENAENISFALRIMACVSLEVQSNDALPKKFCGDCRYQLECTYIFRIKCKNSDSKLRRHLRLVNAGKASRVFEDEDDDEEECSDSLIYIKDYDENQKKIDNDKWESTLQYFEAEKQRWFDEQLKLAREKERKRIFDEANKKLKEEAETLNQNSANENSLPMNDEIELILHEEDEEDEDNISMILGDSLEDDDVIAIEDESEPHAMGMNHAATNLMEEENLEDFIMDNLEEQYIITQMNDDAEEIEGDADDDELAAVTKAVRAELAQQPGFNINKGVTMKLEKASNNLTKVEVTAEDGSVIFMEFSTEDFQTDHNMDRNIFSCSDCPVKFERRNLLNRHRSVHMKEKGNTCDICQKWCPTKSALDRHFRVHTGEKPFKCDICGRAFIQKEVLKRHLMMHSGVRPFGCSMCDKKFIQKDLLRQHFDRKHRPDPVITLHKCSLCPKSFCHSSGLSRHFVVHQGRNFKCEFCPKCFVDKSALKRHTTKVHANLLSTPPNPIN